LVSTVRTDASGATATFCGESATHWSPEPHGPRPATRQRRYSERGRSQIRWRPARTDSLAADTTKEEPVSSSVKDQRKRVSTDFVTYDAAELAADSIALAKIVYPRL
jgi:hypothetical protein